MKYFVTGATGFIENRVVRKLVSTGHQVVALVRDTEKAKDLNQIGVTLFQGDITDKESLKPAIEGTDGVYHIAAWYEIGIKYKDLMHQINVEGTRNVLEVMKTHGIKKGVYTSTVGVFSDTHGQLLDETHRPNGPFLSEYEKTKWIAHYKVAEPMMQAGLPLAIVMPGAVYGPGDHSLVGEAFRQYIQGKLPVIPKKTAYCWAHVEDVAEGHILAMEKGKAGETYCIAGPPHTLEEVFRIAETITGIKPPRMKLSPWIMRFMSGMMKPLEKIFPVPPTFSSEGLRVSAGATYLCSNVKAKRELGYKPRPVNEGLRETLSALMKEIGT